MLKCPRIVGGVLAYTVIVTYCALAGWMHVWALERGLPAQNQSAEPHHQVCTWIGTSGEAGLVTSALYAPPKPTIAFQEQVPFSVPILAITPSVLQARAPPLHSHSS